MPSLLCVLMMKQTSAPEGFILGGRKGIKDHALVTFAWLQYSRCAFSCVPSRTPLFKMCCGIGCILLFFSNNLG